MKTALVAENIGGQLLETKSIENFISMPLTEGPDLSDKFEEHLACYEVKLLLHRKVTKIVNDDLKIISLDSGEILRSKMILLATGAKWRELGIPGEKKYLGKGVAFCPHCDGPYYKNKDVAIVGGGNSGVEAAIDLAGIVKSVTVVEFMPELKADAVLVNKAKSLSNVEIVTNAKVIEITGTDEKVSGLSYQERDSQNTRNIAVAGVFVQIGLSPNSGFVKNIVETNNYGEIIVDEKGRTRSAGIYAAGDVTTVPYKQIIIATGEGAKAALSAYEDFNLR